MKNIGYYLKYILSKILKNIITIFFIYYFILDLKYLI